MPYKSGDVAKARGGKDNPANQLVPSQFAEALVRLAAAKYARPEGAEPQSPLSERVRALMEGPVARHACRTDLRRFRADVAALDVVRGTVCSSLYDGPQLESVWYFQKCQPHVEERLCFQFE